MKFVLTFLLLVFVNSFCNAQCSPELKKYAASFDSLKANSFTFLDSQLTDVRIVGYGEDTHGTSEFTVLAKELMEYLSDKHGFKIFILETGFGEGVYLDDYIQGVRDDLKIILDEHNSTWRYKTEEFYQLMNWLRAYNQNNSEKIHLYGCEMQYVISDVNRIQDYLKTVDSDYKIEGFEKHLWQPIEESEKSDYYLSYIKLKKYFIDNFETFKSKTSEESFNLAYHHIEVLGQFVTAINQNAEQRKHDFRDIYMGENIQWILDFQGQQSKAFYWAHNAHVGDWVDNGIVDVAGHQLRKIYGESYFNIATDFGFGEFLAFSSDWKMEPFSYDQIVENTFTECLKSFGNPNAFLNIREARKDKSLHELLNMPLTTMSGAGAQVRTSQTETQEIGKAFDAIIYLDRTTKISWAK
ncbi:erythromycin esterase family protein [Algoriphagus sp. D3-2-R+10]|uniref:erythromycin esterase family protein n=1 Tax=Algoriphagus aurantiacus TaxID=3103948 RepID=UPI002B368443|nr:erythromycin esterase family protein [Algoriphagus sp. D3-2-R+10]MEB2776407.1 erythromycin esterase family protein [Algoriphagus sp. D3-2-R+10]